MRVQTQDNRWHKMQCETWESTAIYFSVLFYPPKYGSWVKPPWSCSLVYGEHNGLHTNLEFSFFSSNVRYQKLNPPRRVGVSTSATAYASCGLSETEGMENRPVLTGLQLKEHNPQTNPFFKPSVLSLESIHVVDDGASLQMETSRAARVRRTPCNAYHMLFESQRLEKQERFSNYTPKRQGPRLICSSAREAEQESYLMASFPWNSEGTGSTISLKLKLPLMLLSYNSL